jgi:hypothetical protein
MDYPLGAAGVQNISATQPTYTCNAQGALGSRITDIACEVTLPRSSVNQASKDTYDVKVTLGALAAQTTLTVFRPQYSLSISDDTLRRLSSQNCSSAVFEDAKVVATATFVHPADESKELQVDLTAVANLSVSPSAAAQMQNGFLTPSAPVADATVQIGAAVPNSPLTTAHFTVLDEMACVDELVPVVASTAQLGVLKSSPGLVTVQLTVQQKFSNPGDEGVVAVYAQRVSGDNQLLSTDVTRLVCSYMLYSLTMHAPNLADSLHALLTVQNMHPS